jgi:hypothetical protein
MRYVEALIGCFLRRPFQRVEALSESILIHPLLEYQLAKLDLYFILVQFIGKLTTDRGCFKG